MFVLSLPYLYKTKWIYVVQVAAASFLFTMTIIQSVNMTEVITKPGLACERRRKKCQSKHPFGRASQFLPFGRYKKRAQCTYCMRLPSSSYIDSSVQRPKSNVRPRKPITTTRRLIDHCSSRAHEYA